MTDQARASDAFFAHLAASPDQPLLKRACGTVRFDLHDGGNVEYWHLTLDKGSTSVSRRNLRADGVVQADKAAFDQICTGSMNAMAAVLRGELAVDGDLALVMVLWRLFPGPSGERPIDLREQKATAHKATAQKDLAPKSQAAKAPKGSGRQLAAAGRSKK